jgi:hypothetical protein
MGHPQFRGARKVKNERVGHPLLQGAAWAAMESTENRVSRSLNLQPELVFA